MASNGTDFELLVKAIYEEILLLDDYKTIAVKHNVNIKGKSSQLHQIDVYWEFEIAGVIHKVAVECKEYKNNVSVGKVRDFYGAIEDIGNINGIFVTTKGYQSGAITYAKHKNISLKTVNEPTQEDIDSHQGIKTIIFNINAMCLENVQILPKLNFEWLKNNTNLKEGDEIRLSAFNNEIKIMDSNFNSLGTILDFQNKLPRKPENTEGLIHNITFDDAYMHIPNSKYPPLKIDELNFKYDTYTINTEQELHFKLLAEAVIKDIITGESYLYNKRKER